MSYRVGLTGGIASGKSTVADMFAELGVDVIDTDVIAREIVEPGMPALEAIRAEFGDDVITNDGRLDRRRMRAAVFADEQRRRRLEDILHPRIRAEAERRSRSSSSEYHIVVVPLLTESPMREQMDRVLVVDCDEATQLERLLERDTESQEQARRMIDAQVGREARLAVADDVVDNGGDLVATRRQVERLHQFYLERARNLTMG